MEFPAPLGSIAPETVVSRHLLYRTTTICTAFHNPVTAQDNFIHWDGILTKEKTLLLCVVALAEIASAQTNVPAPTIQTIVARMAKARLVNRASFRPYTVTRDYRLFGKDGQNEKSQVIVDVSFVPPGQKNFAVMQARGTAIGEKIVRRMLASEVEIANDNSTDISPDNYNFGFVKQEFLFGRLCYLLELVPRRKDAHLMLGKAWVDAKTYLLHRAEGEPAKKPSWWVRDLHFVLTYGSVSGMWLPTALEATADVRIFGQCKLTSQNLGINVRQFAANRTPDLPVRKRTDRPD